MKITRPCIRPEQPSFSARTPVTPKRHRWKRGACIHCGLKKKKVRVDACDCGCRTPIFKDTLTTQYGGYRFVFGHETLDLFEGNPGT